MDCYGGYGGCYNPCGGGFPPYVPAVIGGPQGATGPTGPAGIGTTGATGAAGPAVGSEILEFESGIFPVIISSASGVLATGTLLGQTTALAPVVFVAGPPITVVTAPVNSIPGIPGISSVLTSGFSQTITAGGAAQTITNMTATFTVNSAVTVTAGATAITFNVLQGVPVSGGITTYTAIGSVSVLLSTGLPLVVGTAYTASVAVSIPLTPAGIPSELQVLVVGPTTLTTTGIIQGAAKMGIRITGI